jgi:hypothetical protein
MIVTICIILFIITVLDMGLTWYGVRNKHIRELNPIVEWCFKKSLTGTCIIVTAITGGLLYWVSTVKMDAAIYAMLVVFGFKMIALGMHGFWIFRWLSGREDEDKEIWT